jgi:hypothetical protein
MASHGNQEGLGVSVEIQNGKVVLTPDKVLEIYKCKLAFEKHNNGIRARGLSVSVSSMYKVSPKAIRDIWNHITWKPVTCHLWQNDVDRRNTTPENSSLSASPGCFLERNVRISCLDEDSVFREADQSFVCACNVCRHSERFRGTR